ncbi:MAG: hypothetical protein KAI53_05530 [Candidatus Aenigmarchaeota archaeon]|nr:hypothetical protein [Candidatus Aenigmarchaeota archaeon]
MTQKEITKVDIVSTAKVFAATYTLLGFVLGLFMALFMTGTPQLMGMGFIGLIIIPIIYGLLGLIAGVLMAAIYNFIVKYTGGIKVEVK